MEYGHRRIYGRINLRRLGRRVGGDGPRCEVAHCETGHDAHAHPRDVAAGVIVVVPEPRVDIRGRSPVIKTIRTSLTHAIS